MRSLEKESFEEELRSTFKRHAERLKILEAEKPEPRELEEVYFEEKFERAR
jgi:Tfp pilus assembly protein PilO